MKQETFIRVTNVRHDTKGTCFVSFYDDDIETEILWRTSAPLIGDIIAIDPANPDLKPRLVSHADPAAWSTDGDALRWRKPLPGSHLSRMEVLRRRHAIRHAARAYLDADGFIEIDAPLLVEGTSPDTAVSSFAVGNRYLSTSTEYQLKRLAVGGFNKLYSLTKNFRFGDSDTAFRNPEFTMLEWGRVGETMHAIEQDAEGLTRATMRALDLPDAITYQGRIIHMESPWQRQPVAEAIEQHTGAKFSDFDAASCAKALTAAGVEVRDEWREHGDFLFSLLMEHIQPKLGLERPVFLTEWPLYQTASAAADGDTKRARRSELFIAGIELADGFSGVADPDLQAQYFNLMATRRAEEKQPAVALDERYIAALRQGAPHGAGMAMGFDRLVMLLTNQPQIRNVLAFAWDEV